MPQTWKVVRAYAAQLEDELNRLDQQGFTIFQIFHAGDNAFLIIAHIPH
jgi:hypothetical protein